MTGADGGGAAIIMSGGAPVTVEPRSGTAVIGGIR